MRIKNKIESMEKINKLGLNQLPGVYLDEFDEKKLKEFLVTNPAKFYVVRDKAIAASPKTRRVKLDELVDYCKESKIEKFAVEVALYNYCENQVLVGEIHIHGDTIDYILSNKSHFTLRDCYGNPDYNGTTDIFDKKLQHIKGFKEIMDYAFKHRLLDVIIEFSVFDCSVGIKDENIVIWELRTDY